MTRLPSQAAQCSSRFLGHSFGCAAGIALALVLAATAPVAAQTQLITRDLEIESIHLRSLDDHHLAFRHSGRDDVVTLATDRALAVLFNGRTSHAAGLGLLRLNDGQQFPGEVLYGVDSPEDVFVWSHPLLGRLDVPVPSISSVSFDATLEPPQPGEADVIILANGDRISGFVLTLGDPVRIESNGDRPATVIDIPLRRIAAITLITPPRDSQGRRLWLTDGTILDVQSLQLVAAGRFQVAGQWSDSTTQSFQIPQDLIAAVQLHPDRLVPLATLHPRRMEGPVTRYVIPAPISREPDALLKLSSLEFRGPLAAHYMLPAGTRRFAAEAELPPTSRAWGEFELIVRVDGAVVFRRHFDSDQPRASINLPVAGAELTIELTDGPHGAIQNHIILQQPMLLVEPR